MKKSFKTLAALTLIAALVMLPGLAFAAGWVNVKYTCNGKTQTFRIPIEEKGGKYTFIIDLTKLLKGNAPKPGNNTPPANNKPETPPADNKPETPPVQGLTADEKQMLDLVNAERIKAGLKPLEIDMRLVDLARKKSKDMIDNNYFGHTSPVYGSPFDMMKAAGISYRYAGENIAGAPTVQRAHDGLMNSPGHRANILNPNYNRIGIGIVNGGPYGKMFTQLFIGTE
ncbi:MAG: CAP domain-containing protein [Thermosediminibacteraceae bacterium]|nr:CAP domain-containing protein [Thermosediminibacteraceae bacterium]